MSSSVSRLAGQGRSLLLRNVNQIATPGPSEVVDVLVVDGVVVSVGPALVSDGVEVFDMDGRFGLRGLWDHHVHFDQLALTRQRVDLSGTDSAAEVIALVTERLRAEPAPGDEPLAGFGLRDGLWEDPPSLDRLDAVSPVRPVVLASQDLHSAWLNSAAFRRFGIPVHSDGIVREEEFGAALRALNEVPAATVDAWVHEAARSAASRGLVGVIELEHSLNHNVWSRRVAAGNRNLRVECGVYASELDEVIELGLRTGDVLDGTYGLVSMGPLKVLTDGSLNTRTAYCYDPYPGLEGSPDSHGLLVVPPEELVPLMTRAHAAGLDCAIHAIGDHANTLALDAFESIGCRGSIEHAQLLNHTDLRRFAELGVIASVQPQHAVDDRDVADRHWTGRTERAFAYADLLAAGATLRMGSDAPVAPLDPWITIASAVHRSDDDRPSWHAEQEIPIAAALDASTRGRTYIREGDTADLVITDLDPLTAAPKELRTMPVYGTLLAGRWTWRAD